MMGQQLHETALIGDVTKVGVLLSTQDVIGHESVTEQVLPAHYNVDLQVKNDTTVMELSEDQGHTGITSTSVPGTIFFEPSEFAFCTGKTTMSIVRGVTLVIQMWW